MSIKVMSYVWEHATVTGSELLVLLALADYADDEGNNIFPSMPAIAKKSRLSVDQARRVTHKLVEEKVIRLVAEGGWRNGRNWSNEYSIILKNVAMPLQQEGVLADCKGGTRAGARGGTRAGASTVPAPARDDPSYNHHNQPSCSSDTDSTAPDPCVQAQLDNPLAPEEQDRDDVPLAEIERYWQRNIGKVNDAVGDALLSLRVQYGGHLVLDAVKEAIVNNSRPGKPTMGFVRAIAKRKHADNKLSAQRRRIINSSYEPGSQPIKDGAVIGDERIVLDGGLASYRKKFLQQGDEQA